MKTPIGRTDVRALLAIPLLVALGTGIAVPAQAGRPIASNLGRPDDGVEIVSNTRWLASQFRTDGSSYVLDSVTLRLLATSGGKFEAAIYSDNGGKPGRLLGVLQTSGKIGATPSDVLFRSSAGTGTGTMTSKRTTLSAADLGAMKLPGGVNAADFLGGAAAVTTNAEVPNGLILDPDTKYWIVSRAISGQFASVYTDDEKGTGTGFSPEWAHSETSGKGWTNETLSPLIYAATVSPYAPVNLIELRVDQEAIASAVLSGLPMALVQREVAFTAAREAIRGVTVSNRRLLQDPEGKRYGWEWFTAGGYGSSDLDSRYPAAGFQSDLFSGTVGLERRVCSLLSVGAAFTYLESANGLGLSTGTVDITGQSVTGFAALNCGPVFANLLYSWGNFEHEIRRDTLFGHTASGHPDSRTHTLAADLGANFKVGGFITGPLASLTYIAGDLDKYRESGGGTARLAFDGQNFDSLVSVVGWHLARSFQAGNLTITPEVRAAWWHEHRNRSESVADRLVDSPFQLGSGEDFVHVGSFGTSAESQPPSRDALEIGGALTFLFSDRLSLTVDYLGRILQGAALSHSVVLTGKVEF